MLIDLGDFRVAYLLVNLMKITKEHKTILVKAVSFAKANGFDIDDSFFTDVDVEDKLFDGMKGYYNVIFDHEFARSFWKEDIGIDLIMDDHPDGEIPKTVDLVATLHEGKHPIAALFLNEESVRIPLWQYNLSQMVLSEDPLMYIKNTLVEAGLMKP